MNLSFRKPVNVAIVGLNLNAINLATDLQNKKFDKKYNFIGYFSDYAHESISCPASHKILGNTSSIVDLVNHYELQEVYLSLPILSDENTNNVLASLRETTASVYFLPDLLFSNPINPGIKRVGRHNLLTVCSAPSGIYANLLKRLLDISLSILLLLMFAPLFLVIACVICMESKGSPFFSQMRYGLNGERIEILKFRTMKINPDHIVIAARKEDERVTRIGKFLRKYSIDELPQLVDVLLGKMSLVGPRPLAIEHNHEYKALVSGFMVRHKVKPGITGLAQVNGVRGAPGEVMDIQRRLDFDINYIQTWSNFQDLKILTKTGYQFLLGKNCGY